MAYVPKHRRVRDLRQEFRQEFPQLCAPAEAPKPLDFTVLKKEEEVVVKPKELPEGWINVRTYLQTYVPPFEPEEDAHTLMYRCVRKMRGRWEKWNREHEVFVDYDHYDDGLIYDDVSETTSESSYAEDPDDEWSD